MINLLSEKYKFSRGITKGKLAPDEFGRQKHTSFSGTSPPWREANRRNITNWIFGGTDLLNHLSITGYIS